MTYSARPWPDATNDRKYDKDLVDGRHVIEFKEQWNDLKQDGCYSGTVGLELSPSGVAGARFVYPAGKYSVQSSSHWGIGIVRQQFNVAHCAFGTATSGKRDVHASELIISEPDAYFDAHLKSGTAVDYVMISRDRFDASLPKTESNLNHLPHYENAFFHSPLLTHLTHALVDRLSRNDMSYDFYADAMTDAIIAELCKEVSGEEPKNERPANTLDQSDLEAIDAYIRSNIHARITFSELAALIDMNPTAFSKCFKSTFGITPYQHVLEHRVDTARAMLVTTDLSIAQIAFACGFSSQSHITDVFKQRVGVSPGAFRKQAGP